jgi:hypothetical protein
MQMRSLHEWSILSVQMAWLANKGCIFVEQCVEQGADGLHTYPEGDLINQAVLSHTCCVKIYKM